MLARCLSRSVLLCLSLFLTITVLWSQGSAPGSTDSTKNDQEIDPLMEFRFLPPQSLEKDFLNREFEQKILDKIKDHIKESKEEIKSFYQTLNFRKQNVEDRISFIGSDYYRIDPSLTPNIYHNLIAYNDVKNQFYLDRTIERLTQLEKMYNRYHDTLKLVFQKQELKNIVYEIQSLLGLLHLYKGDPGSLNQSIDKFDFLLGKNPFNDNFVEGDETRKKVILEHLVSLHHYLQNYYQNVKNRLADHHKLKKLEHMWDLVKMNHQEDPVVMRVKQKRLLDPDQYSSALLSKSEKYQEFVERYEKIVQEEIESKNNSDQESLNQSIDTSVPNNDNQNLENNPPN